MANTPGISNDPYINDGYVAYVKPIYNAAANPLPAAAGMQGSRLWVNDHTSLSASGITERGVKYASGGTTYAKVQSDGTNWYIDG